MQNTNTLLLTKYAVCTLKINKSFTKDSKPLRSNIITWLQNADHSPFVKKCSLYKSIVLLRSNLSTTYAYMHTQLYSSDQMQIIASNLICYFSSLLL